MSRKIVLDNGLRVVTERMPLSESFTVGISIRPSSKRTSRAVRLASYAHEPLKLVDVRGLGAECIAS